MLKPIFTSYERKKINSMHKLTQKKILKMLQKKRLFNYLPEICWDLSSSEIFHFNGDDSLTLYEI